ncbi:MAG: leucine-rich repeat protein [Blautia sp.]|nr:leucine-rich repeat protein [Lachnoclostridium sp.]MCM1211267.1 leucine-rich repeat protein [Blautia sp.]
MSKKTLANKSKKSKRRLKRSIRRSLAAILMITAIGVAAIPVPENYATDGDDIITDDPDEGDVVVPSRPYAYDVTTADVTVDENVTSAEGKTHKGTSYTVYIAETSPVLIKEFEFFNTRNDGQGANIISRYNKNYLRDTIYVYENITTEYNVIEKTTYNTWYANTNNSGKTYKLQMNDNANNTKEAEDFLQKFFAAEYQTYLDQCKNYKQGDAYIPVIEKTPADLSPENKLIYYCDKTPGLEGFKLVEVIDERDKSMDVVEDSTGGTGSGTGSTSGNTAANNKTVYIPQKITLTAGETDLSFDQNGFSRLNTTSIRGIGDEVFYGVQNVTSLVTSDAIPMEYIGVSAFENSYLESINISNIRAISDRAFKGCHIVNLSIGKNTQVIGTEAFCALNLQEVRFPEGSGITEIGPGAFAKCGQLRKIDFSQVPISSYLKIDRYAFYNAVALDSVIFMGSGKDTTMEEFNKPSAADTVQVGYIGEGAFAVEDTATGGMNMFTFPTFINNADSLGDYVLAGRANLQYVTMPARFGKDRPSPMVPDNTFYYCFNLACVKFPDNNGASCGFANYNSKILFSTVTNEDFYVKGPEMTLPNGNDPASPRQATWEAETAVSKTVPYLYVRKNKEYYEISDGTYLLCIDSQGVLTSCTRKNKNSSGIVEELVIPEQVGNVKVTSIAKNCFSDEGLNDSVRKLLIEDNSISKIDDEVFKGWEILEKVTIGNSVKSIGKEAFKDCNQLIDVTFNSPEDHASFTIGTDAFKTGSDRLTFHGDIVNGYAPFTWAMDKNNIIKTDENGNGDIRVCYQSLFPTYLTVMYNPNTDMVTLLDYPKSSQISRLLNKKYESEIDRKGYDSYEDMKEQESYEKYRDSYYNDRRVTFAKRWQDEVMSAADETAKEAAKTQIYNSSDYGPWVNPQFSWEWDEWVNGAPTSTPTPTPPTPDPDEDDDSGDDDSAMNGMLATVHTLTDWLFEPLVVYASDLPDAYYAHEGNAFNIVTNRSAENTFISPSDEEIKLVDATQYIDVPAGVDSIDVRGYCKNLLADGETVGRSRNDGNKDIYLTGRDGVWDAYTETMYSNDSSGTDRDGIRIVPGLFSGKYDDYSLTAAEAEAEGAREKNVRGNDQIKTVKLGSVKYFPDYAFDSCEQLQMVTLGPDCADIGTAPFRGCYTLTNVNCDGNRKYTADNGIIYSRDTVAADTDLGSYEGTYTIEECLYARGKSGGVGTPVVPEPGYSDGKETVTISRVKEIRDGAFEECVNVTKVYLDTALNLTRIPKDCFKNCEHVQLIWMPRTVNYIDEGAFAYDNNLGELSIPGKEVFISAKAFVDAKVSGKTLVTTVTTYADSSARRYAEKYADDYLLDYQEKTSEWTVVFLDADGNQIGDTLYKINNSKLTEDEIPAAPEKEGWVFEKWISTSGAEVSAPITTDTVFIAQGYSANGMVDGKHYTVDFYCQVCGLQMGNTQLIEPGAAAVPPSNMPDHDHKGYTFTKWSSDEYLNVQKNLTILGMFSGSGTSGGSSGTTSKGSSNTSNKTSNNTSNSSTSSTSATSTSTGATGKYTVTVVNGSGSGSYDVGTTVIIAANTPATGKVFSKWTTESQGVTLASVSMTATTFVMPANNVTITANYVDGAPAAGGTVSTGTGNTNNRDTGNGSTRVDITKPGISNKDLATATVNGSTDNFVVKISETDEATQAVVNALTNKYGNLESILYYAMDISLYDSTGTTKITNTQGLSVDITIPLPDALTLYAGNNMAGAVVSDQLEDLSERFTTINGIPCISFTATHFSPYTIYVNTQNLSEGLLDSTPKTGDPIHPKWFLSLGLACLSIILFMKKDKKSVKVKTV